MRKSKKNQNKKMPLKSKKRKRWHSEKQNFKLKEMQCLRRNKRISKSKPSKNKKDRAVMRIKTFDCKNSKKSTQKQKQ